MKQILPIKNESDSREIDHIPQYFSSVHIHIQMIPKKPKEKRVGQRVDNTHSHCKSNNFPIRPQIFHWIFVLPTCEGFSDEFSILIMIPR